MATTLSTLEANIARSGFGYIAITPSGAGNAGKTTIVSDAAGSQLDPDDTARLMGSAWLKCVSDSAGTPLNVGEIRRLDAETGYTPSSGTLTVTRPYSNATTTTQRFEVYAGVPPEDVGFHKGLKTYINDVLRRMYYHRQFLLTLITDGDMETSGVTNWTRFRLDNTLSIKSTSTGVTLGKQASRVKCSSANGYAQSVTVAVEPGENYLVAADVTIVSGTAVLELWDVTDGVAQRTGSAGAIAFDNVAKTITDTGNGLAIFATGNIIYTNATNNPGPFTITTGGVAGTITCSGATFTSETPAGAISITKGPAIDSATCAELQKRRVWFIADIPATCRQVAVRLVGTEATADIYWDNVSLINQSASEMSLPSWFANKKWLEWLKEWRPGNTSAAYNDKALDDIERQPGVWFDVIEDREAVTPFKVKYDIILSSDALLVGEALCPYTELSADSDSTEANADLVKAFALSDIYLDKGDEKKAAIWQERAQALERQHPVRWSGRRFKVRW